MRYINDWEKENSKTIIISLDEIINNIDNLQIESISIQPELIIGQEVTIKYVDKEHPVCISNDSLFGSTLGIEKEYLDQHKDEIIEKLKIILSKINTSYMSIPSELMSNDLLKAVCSNSHIKTLIIGSKKEPYILTKEDFEMVKNSNLESIDTQYVVPELENVFDSKIEYNNKKKLVLNYKYPQLSTEDIITINRPLTEEEMQNLCFVKDNCTIEFKQFHDYNNIFKTIDSLKSLNKNFKCRIIVEGLNNENYKNIFNEYIFNNYDEIDNNIFIVTENDRETSLKDYVKYEKQLYELIKPAFNLSPLEKYIFAYNVAKKYKEYKENEEDKGASRHLYEILDGEYMVCVGFVRMLKDLLDKLGVNSSEISVGVDIGYDNVEVDATNIPDDIVTKSAGHARLRVNIVDPKYDVDGIYISDPTWDNVLDEDSYSYALMTQDEYIAMKRYNFLNFTNVDELYAVHSLEEFYSKVNTWLDKTPNYLNEFNKKAYKDGLDRFKNMFNQFMNKLKEIDPKNYEWYNATYKNLYSMNKLASNTKRFMSRIQNVLKQNNNKELNQSYESLKDAYNSLNYRVEEERKADGYKYKDLLTKLINSLKEIEPAKYRELIEKYSQVFGYNADYIKDNYKEILFDIGTYIVSKSNKQIDGKTLMAAIRELYTNVYNVEDVESTMDHIKEYNKDRMTRYFPPRYKIDKEDNKELYYPVDNKFDLEVVDKKTI